MAISQQLNIFREPAFVLTRSMPSYRTSTVCLSEGVNREETGQDITSPFTYLFFLHKFLCVFDTE